MLNKYYSYDSTNEEGAQRQVFGAKMYDVEPGMWIMIESTRQNVCRNKNSAALTKTEVLVMRSRMSKSRLQKTFPTKGPETDFFWILWHQSPGTSVCRPGERELEPQGYVRHWVNPVWRDLALLGADGYLGVTCIRCRGEDLSKLVEMASSSGWKSEMRECRYLGSGPKSKSTRGA